MLRNERQVRVARRKLDEVHVAMAQAGSADREVLDDFAADLEREIAEYEAIRDGHAATFGLESLDDLADALVKARIARGWTQRELADRLGVSEQMVQRDEAGGYAKATLARLVDVADALGCVLRGTVDVPRRERHRQHRRAAD